MRIDQEMLEVMEKTRGMESKQDANGNIIAWKGPFLPHWYDNYTECLRENQNERRRQILAKEGKNEHGQTPEQQKEFARRQKIQQQRKEKAEAALLASDSINKGGN